MHRKVQKKQRLLKDPKNNIINMANSTTIIAEIMNVLNGEGPPSDGEGTSDGLLFIC